MESTVVEKEELAKVVVDLEARLKEAKSKLEETELRASKEREAIKELEEELLVYKKKVVEQDEKGFYKVIRQAGWSRLTFNQSIEILGFVPPPLFFKKKHRRVRTFDLPLGSLEAHARCPSLPQCKALRYQSLSFVMTL